MLSELKNRTPDKFALIEAELKSAWVARMKQMIEKVHGKTVLLWLTDYLPTSRNTDSLGPSPIFIDDAMMAELAPLATAVVRIDPSEAARNAGVAGMSVAPLDEPAAAGTPGPGIHSEIAVALAETLRKLI
jgi:hypothetical protein